MALKYRNEGKEVTSPLPENLRDDEYGAVSWGIKTFGGEIEKFVVPRHKVGEWDVKLEMMFCGVCHTDVVIGLNDVPGAIYPIVTGHELVGVVCEVGPKVTKLRVGDVAAVGCIIDSCMSCRWCNDSEENYCDKGFTHTYSTKKNPAYSHIGGNPDTQNFGGYTQFHTVNERFCYKLPAGIDMAKAAPILCAGITMWDPLRQWGATKPGAAKMKIGIAGIGGLGTMGIKFAAALGHESIAISSSDRKKTLAKEKGATGYVVSTDPASVEKHLNSFDLILDTIPVDHDAKPYISMLGTKGVLVFLGVAQAPYQIGAMDVLYKRKVVTGSLIGGVKSTEECIKFCYDNSIYPDIKIITADQLTETWNLLESSNPASLRYVIDIKKSLKV